MKASQTSFGVPKFLEQSGIDTQLSRDSIFLQDFGPLSFRDTGLLLYCSGARIFVVALWDRSPGQGSDSQHCVCAPSRITHHTMDSANSYSLSARQCYHMFSCSGVDANPSSFNASFCQLPLSSLHLSVCARLVECKFSKDLFSELRNHTIPLLAGQSSPSGVTVVTNLITSYHECCMANQPAHDRQRQLQFDSDSSLQREHEPPGNIHNILCCFLGTTI